MKIIYVLILSLVFNSYCIAEKTYEEKIIEQENNIKWVQTEKYEGALSYISTLMTMARNFKIIDKVQKGELEHKKLKDILDKFDETIELKGKSKNTFIELYEYLIKQLPSNKETKGAFNILELLDNGGDCNDIASSFYSLFRYYGFDLYVVVGRMIEDKKTGLHVWVGFEEKKKFIELDPTWYQQYFELDRVDARIWERITDIKDEYKRSRYKK